MLHPSCHTDCLDFWNFWKSSVAWLTEPLKIIILIKLARKANIIPNIFPPNIQKHAESAYKANLLASISFGN